MDGYPQRDTIFEFDYFISSVRSIECFLFGFLFTRVLLASASFDVLPFFPYIFLRTYRFLLSPYAVWLSLSEYASPIIVVKKRNDPVIMRRLW